jgi:hypothetical protein
MINEIKTIVKNYLNNAMLTNLQVGSVVSGGIKVSDKLVLPMEIIQGNLKDYVSNGDTVRLIRNHGGLEFYIVEIIGKEFVTKGSTVTLSRDGSTYDYIVEDVIK